MEVMATGSSFPTPAKWNCPSASHPEQEAIAFNRPVMPVAPTVSINIDTSRKSVTIVDKANGEKIAFRYFNFELKGKTFGAIQGNNRHGELAELLGQDTVQKEVSFKIETSGQSQEYIPSRQWQKRFLECIHSGMEPIMNRSLNQLITFFIDLFPSCHQFVNFVETGSSSYIASVFDSSESIKELASLGHFTVLGLYDEGRLVHSFIHIADGVCIGKMGADGIFFHGIKDAADFYTDLLERPLELKVRYIGSANHYKRAVSLITPSLHHYCQKAYSMLTGQDVQVAIPERETGYKYIFIP